MKYARRWTIKVYDRQLRGCLDVSWVDGGKQMDG